MALTLAVVGLSLVLKYQDLLVLALSFYLSSNLSTLNNWLANEDVQKALASPYQSESFGGYSYTKASAGSSDSGEGITWQKKFKSQLNQWRKIR